jgi:polysaccharide biosynthesis protein PslA
VLRMRAVGIAIVLDVAIVISTLAGARMVGQSPLPWLATVAVLLPLYFGLAVNGHAYSIDCVQDPMRSPMRAARSLLMSIGALILVAYCLRASANFSRLNISTVAVIGPVLLAIGRYLLARNIVALIGGRPYSSVLLCEPDQPIPTGDFSVLVASAETFDPECDDPMMYDRLARAIQGADRVLVSCSLKRRSAWVSALKGANVQAEVIVPELDQLRPLGVGMAGNARTLIVANGPLGIGDRVIKRMFDVSVAVTMIALLSPVFLLAALAVKLDSRGPVFFKQTRIGRGNQMFMMLKFRSMRVESSDGGGVTSTARDDARITRVGRFIRATSLDELPQLINVLRGEMSIVGPRPHALRSRAADKLFWEVDSRYWHRHAAKPGLTGLAQVRGFRGATVKEDDLVNRLQADLEYLDHWSVWRDLLILFLTVRVLIHRNAF